MASIKPMAFLLFAVVLGAAAGGAVVGSERVPCALGMRLRGGGLEQLASETCAPARGWKTERDPVKRKELFNQVPRMNHKEEWQKWKSERMPKKSRGPILRELCDFACGTVVNVSLPAAAPFRLPKSLALPRRVCSPQALLRVEPVRAGRAV